MVPHDTSSGWPGLGAVKETAKETAGWENGYPRPGQPGGRRRPWAGQVTEGGPVRPARRASGGAAALTLLHGELATRDGRLGDAQALGVADHRG